MTMMTTMTTKMTQHGQFIFSEAFMPNEPKIAKEAFYNWDH